MALNKYEDLSDIHLDVLREIGNIGSGNAATSLSSMLDRPINIDVPKVRILDYNQVVEALGGPENMIVGLLLMLAGEVEGMIMFLLEQNFAKMTLSALLGENYEEFMDEEGEMGNSAMKEVGNIMAAAYVNAISTMSGMSISISTPDICTDMCGAIVNAPAVYYANISDKIIFIENKMSSDEEHSNGYVLMIPDVESLQKIMTNLGIEI